MPTKAQISAAATRMGQLRAAMKQADVDGLVVSQQAAIRYLTGFSGSTSLLILTSRNAYFFTNDLYEVQIAKELYTLPGLQSLVHRDFWKTVKDAGIANKAKRFGFVPTLTTVTAHKAMKKAVAPAKLVEVADLISPITMVKTKAEIAAIAKAADIASTAYQRLLGVVQPGMTEHQVANFLANTTRELGSERDAFDIIAVAGARSAMPHGRASKAPLQKGQVVTVDFGCCVDGLHSDMTRTFCVGTPSKKVVDVFAVLYDAHLSALDAAMAGVTADGLDAAARNVITKAGYGENFRHSLGHGLGYDVHENPRVAHGNTSNIIPENCVITIEPGIYLPGKFGMRIEDDVVIK
jgi:Xaa-Pro aminopeptidase